MRVRQGDVNKKFKNIINYSLKFIIFSYIICWAIFILGGGDRRKGGRQGGEGNIGLGGDLVVFY